MAKEEIQPYKKSINESSFSSEQIAMIWDFYVTKSIAASASQKRTAKDYGLKSLPWKNMCIEAGSSPFFISHKIIKEPQK
jgi:hypothetical protein